MAVEVEWIDDEVEWRAYRDVWDDVVGCAVHASIFLTWDFLETSWLHFAQPTGDRLAVFAFRDEGRLIGCAAFCLSVGRRYGLPIRVLTPLVREHADYHAPLILPHGRERECVEALVSLLERRGGEWDSLSTYATGPEMLLREAMREWTARRPRALRLVEAGLSPSPYISLDAADPLDWLGSTTRKSIRRYRRQLEAEGPLTMEVFDEAGQMQRALDLYLEIEDRSWKRGAQQGVGKDRQSPAFFRDLLPRLAARKGALLMFLKLGERRIAGNIDFLHGTSVHSSHTTFDQAYARYSPGNLLLSVALPWYAEHGFRTYELWARFLGNKQRFTELARENLNLRVLQVRGLRRRALFLPGMVKRALRRR